MPIFEFQCPKGHITTLLVPRGTQVVACEHKECPAEVAKRILSPTPTTFSFAGGRKL